MGLEIALAASTAVSMASQIMQGISEKNAEDANAQMQRQQAESERATASAKITEDDYQALQVMGAQSAAAGAAGVTQTGSVEQVANQSKEEATINDMYTRYSGRLAASRDIYASRQATYQGQQALAAGIMGATSSLTGGAANIYTSQKLGSTGGSSVGPIGRGWNWDWSK